MGLEIIYEEGQSPLDEDEKEGLLFPDIFTRQALDELEQRNIEEALRWTIERRKRFTASEILGVEFVCELHRRMFSGVWKWAGSFRNSNKNIGVDKRQIRIELYKLIDDCKHWLENNIYNADEIALRFKHRVVSIHCFANGNGRHSRLMADIMITKIFRQPIFTWGAHQPLSPKEIRAEYLLALRKADKGDYKSLLYFARS